MEQTGVIAIRHVAFEHAGTLEACLRSRSHAVTYLEAGVDDLTALDPLAPSLLIVLGAPIGAYEESLYPYVCDELSLIERRLAADLPIVGICLGSQLMARALGARVYPAERKEIGWAPISLTPAGERSALVALDACDRMVLHWHGDTFDLPDGTERLASTDVCINQAFRRGKTALGLQFHVEVLSDEIEHWLIGHACEIAGTPGITVPGLRSDTRTHGKRLEQAGDALFTRWLSDLAI